MHHRNIIFVSVVSCSAYRMPISDHFLILFLVPCLKHLFTGKLAKVPLPTEWAKLFIRAVLYLFFLLIALKQKYENPKQIRKTEI